jgi:hypothetical protein
MPIRKKGNFMLLGLCISCVCKDCPRGPAKSDCEHRPRSTQNAISVPSVAAIHAVLPPSAAPHPAPPPGKAPTNRAVDDQNSKPPPPPAAMHAVPWVPPSAVPPPVPPPGKAPTNRSVDDQNSQPPRPPPSVLSLRTLEGQVLLLRSELSEFRRQLPPPSFPSPLRNLEEEVQLLRNELNEFMPRSRSRSRGRGTPPIQILRQIIVVGTASEQFKFALQI